MSESKKGMKLVYDITSRPKSLSFAQMVTMYEQHDIVIWDSSNEGTKPALFTVDGKEAPLAIVDIKGEVVNMEVLDRMLEDEDFWEKEVYRCRLSPVYFFSNYGTEVYPPVQSDITAYINSLELEMIETDDADEAKERWENQKDKTRKAMEFVTRELLEARKGSLDVLRAQYDQRVGDLEVKVLEHVKLTDKDGKPLEEKQRKINLVDKIARTPVLPKYGDNYRTRRGKWDKAILFTTSYDILLQIFYDVLETKDSK